MNNDDVTQPSHYMLFPDMESIEAIECLLSPEEFRGYLKGNILKYRNRAGKKDDTLKDIAKAMQYEDHLVALEEHVRLEQQWIGVL
jgi:hypothetical protein